ncbi:phosphatidylglycerophosphatase A [bacterium]|nr:phosphatidylglycerophosphatase A [bacterium]
MKRFIILFFATGAGTGYAPIASGTIATLIPGIPLYLLFSRLSTPLYIIFLVIFIAAAVYFSEAGDRMLGEKDSHKIVIDELAGYLVTMCFAPKTIPAIAAGFLLFRFYDIVKIQPAKWMEDNLPGGMGVVFDDVMAGIYANITLWAGIVIFRFLL